MNKILTLLLLINLANPLMAQEMDQQIFTVDINNFWITFDSVRSTNDSLKQIHFMQTLYIDKGTEGLRAFMKLRNFDAYRLVKVIREYPKFWQSIRPNTLVVHKKKDSIDHFLQTFNQLYPDYRDAKVYFTISALRSGGTTKGSSVLIGTEIAVGNKYTDVSEFPDQRLEKFFSTQDNDNIIPFVIHEYVHTQQSEEGNTLLGQSIYEGACDFITELVLNRSLGHAYLAYGRKHEEALKWQFKKEMWSDDYSNWLYNGTTSETVGDLGYFMGYTICESYYERNADKKQAIKSIIELPYSDQEKVKQFLQQSQYFEE